MPSCKRPSLTATFPSIVRKTSRPVKRWRRRRRTFSKSSRSKRNRKRKKKRRLKRRNRKKRNRRRRSPKRKSWRKRNSRKNQNRRKIAPAKEVRDEAPLPL